MAGVATPSRAGLCSRFPLALGIRRWGPEPGGASSWSLPGSGAQIRSLDRWRGGHVCGQELCTVTSHPPPPPRAGLPLARQGMGRNLG